MIARPPVQELRLYLEDVKTPEQIEQLRQMFFTPDVARNLDLRDSPIERPGKFAVQFSLGHVQGHLVRRKDDDEVIAFFLLHCIRLKSLGVAEVDIAVPDAKNRGQRYTFDAFVCLFDEWLLRGRAKRLWGWIEERNKPSVKMAEMLGLHVVKRGIAHRSVRDERWTSLEVEMTVPQWVTARRRLPYPWPDDARYS